MIERWKDYFEKPFRVLTDDDRERIEAVVDQNLPEAYWELLREHQGQIPVPDRFPLPDGHRGRVGFLLHALDDEDRTPEEGEGCDLFSKFEWVQDTWPAGLVPFSDDTGGNCLAFDYREDGEPAIVFIDHEIAGEAGVQRVAPDFAALVALLRPKG